MIYRIYRMKDSPRENFRWAAHTGGAAVVKPKDYEAAGEVEAATPYAAWKQMAEEEQPLLPGDVLELPGENAGPGELRIAKYIGFEPAQWFVAAPRPELTLNNSADLMPDSTEFNQPH